MTRLEAQLAGSLMIGQIVKAARLADSEHTARKAVEAVLNAWAENAVSPSDPAYYYDPSLPMTDHEHFCRSDR